MSAQPPIDEAKQEEFMRKVLGDLSGTMATVMGIIGDRLGLFKDLAANGPATSDDLAARADVNERYAREWLSGMASAGYLEYDPPSRRFTLPPEHAPAFAHEGGPKFLGGWYQARLATLGQLNQLIQVFQQGGGLPQSAYDDNMWDGMARFTDGWFENLLLQVWIPAMPEVRAKLEHGALVADVGCGRGKALIKMAQAFPNSRYVGFDSFGPTIAKATANAEAAGVAERVSFRQQDVSLGLEGQYDIVCTFDVVHDAVDPRALLRGIRRSLKDDGSYILMDINCSDKLEENAGPISTMFFGASIMYCMTTSLANGGEGLGAMGLPESKVRELCAEAGFRSVDKLAVENPFNNLYEVKP
jgi:SAM-dependent methyltransferase